MPRIPGTEDDGPVMHPAPRSFTIDPSTILKDQTMPAPLNLSTMTDHNLLLHARSPAAATSPLITELAKRLEAAIVDAATPTVVTKRGLTAGRYSSLECPCCFGQVVAVVGDETIALVPASK